MGESNTTGLSGKSFGGFALREILGSGAMAVVYLAWDEQLERDVAVKVLRQHIVSDPEFIARFKREAKIAASLDHPNIVSIFAVGMEDDVHYFVMNCLKGDSLIKLVKEKKRLSFEEAAPIMRGILKGLSYAHTNNVIHRDIKPENIMFDSNKNPVITDFGIAKALGQNLTRTGTSLGTPSYMAPEQVKAGLPVTFKADIYAAGVLFYQLLTGVVPFPGNEPITIGYKHVHEPPPPLKDHCKSIPGEVELFVLKALEKKADDRYENADEMLDYLDKLERNEPLGIELKPFDVMVPRSTVVLEIKNTKKRTLILLLKVFVALAFLAIILISGYRYLEKNEGILSNLPDKVTGSMKTPVSVTKPPVAPTKKAAVVTKKPVAPTKKAVVVTKNPVAPTIKAAVVTKKPVTPTKKAAVATKKPVAPTKKAAVVTKKPVTPTKKAAVVTKKPVTPTKKAAVATKKPATPTKKAAVVTKKPVAPTKKAAVVTKKPVAPTKKAAVATKKPVAPTKKAAVIDYGKLTRNQLISSGLKLVKAGKVKDGLVYLSKTDWNEKNKAGYRNLRDELLDSANNYLSKKSFWPSRLLMEFVVLREPTFTGGTFTLAKTYLAQGKKETAAKTYEDGFKTLAPGDYLDWLKLTRDELIRLKPDGKFLLARLFAEMAEKLVDVDGSSSKELAKESLNFSGGKSLKGHYIFGLNLIRKGNLSKGYNHVRIYAAKSGVADFAQPSVDLEEYLEKLRVKGDVYSQIALKRAKMAKRAFNLHQYSTSKKLYSQICKSFPAIRPCVSYYFLSAGARLLGDGRTKEARELLVISIRFDDMNKKASRLLAESYLDENNFEKAKIYYTQALGKL